MLITNFSSGELSENLYGRVDLPQYQQAVATMKNFEVNPTGGAYRRVGFQRVGRLHGQCRLIPFIIDKDNNFIIEFCPEKIYFWKNDEEIFESIESPYKSIAQINAIQYAQDYDRLIFVEEHNAPHELKYDFINNVFVFGALTFDFSPDVQLDDDFTDEAKDINIVYVCKKRDDGTTEPMPQAEKWKYCVRYGHLYKSTGSAWKNTDAEDSAVFEDDTDSRTTGYEKSGIFKSAGNYPSAVAFFNNRLYLAATIGERQKVYASCTPDTKGNRYTQFHTYQRYITVEKCVKDCDLHSFSGDIKKAHVSNDTIKITYCSQDFTKEGTFSDDITKYYVYNKDYLPIGTMVKRIYKEPDGTITIECTNPATKSKVISFFPTFEEIKRKDNGEPEKDSNGNILYVSGTKDVLNVVFSLQKWKTPTDANGDDFEYKVVTSKAVTADCSFSFELASDQNDAIKWLASGNYLTIGTESSVWNVSAEVSALNISAMLDCRNGSDSIQAHRIDSAIVFFAQGKHGIREYYYNAGQMAFQTNNIALFAEHLLFESPAVDFDYLSNPYHKIIITREDGKIACMLYDKNNGIMAWSRTEHASGLFTSCAVVRGNAEHDILYQAVKYTTTDGEGNKTDDYFLEKLDPNEKVYLDSYTPYTAETQTNDYFQDAIVYAVEQDKEYTIEEAKEKIKEGEKAFIGYKYKSTLVSLPVIGHEPSGKKRVVNLLIRFSKSYFPVLKCDEKTEYFFDEQEPFSGYKYIDYPQNSARDVNFCIEFEDAKPCNILCIQANIA